MFIVIVSAVTEVSLTGVLYAGWCLAGAACSVTSPSKVQVKITEFGLITIVSPACRLCFPMDATNTPVTGLYVASYGVYVELYLAVLTLSDVAETNV